MPPEPRQLSDRSDSSVPAPQIEPDDFGRRLRLAREASGMSQEQLARKVGRAQTTVASWEASRREPNLLALEQLANVLYVNLDWLIRGVVVDPARQGAESALVAIERALARHRGSL